MKCINNKCVWNTPTFSNNCGSIGAFTKCQIKRLAKTTNPMPSAECAGSVENKATPYFGRGYKDRLYLATTSRDEFGEDQETHHYISEKCGKRLLEELAVFL